MLTGFVGAPCSGKTTTASRMFADLKEIGSPSELITEKARSYIAYKQFTCNEQNVPFSLTDQDQLEIAKAQYFAEHIMRSVCGPEVMVITDTAVINSLLYMTPEFRKTPEVQELMQKAVKQYDFLFLCDLVPRTGAIDPNRVHTEDQSKALHLELEGIFRDYAQGVPAMTLVGPSHVRLQHAISAALERKSQL